MASVCTVSAPVATVRCVIDAAGLGADRLARRTAIETSDPERRWAAGAEVRLGPYAFVLRSPVDERTAADAGAPESPPGT